MKIGILTLPIVDNYGGILQAVALYRYLENQGHDVVLIYKDNAHQQALWKKVVISCLLKIPFHDFKKIKTNAKKKQARPQLKSFHRPFIESQIAVISNDLFTKADLTNYVKKEGLEAVIVGSDQVWRKDYISDLYYLSYFLDFVENPKVKRIAYAASFGKDHWEGQGDETVINRLLQSFNSVSTREASGAKVCRETFGYNYAEHVLDPTLLHDANFYLKEVIGDNDIENIKRTAMVTYVLDEALEKKKIIDSVKTKINLSNILHLKGFNADKELFTVPQWLAAFAFSNFIITDSFHGMVFSILFEKNFIVIANHDRGLDRFISLLTLLGLEDRLVTKHTDIEDLSLEAIDYNAVKLLLSRYKGESYAFLNTALMEDE
ncbi:MAG: polysaccharide pyruvyl transferase family protein [Pseudomonadota bacterium]|nr:polysaccharide pyruvyl transferase family protein [Pseudomonadota bacterium]